MKYLVTNGWKYGIVLINRLELKNNMQKKLEVIIYMFGKI